MSDRTPELNPMRTFNPSEPALLHNRLTDAFETWTGEDASDYSSNAVCGSDNTVRWRTFLFDGWSQVLGG